MSLLRSALIYFAVVFGVGFLLGPVRVLALEPRVGARVAELVEAPFMLLAILLTARWIAGRQAAGSSAGELLFIGMIAAVLVILADVAVGVTLRGMSVAQVFTDRDPVAGPVYYALVVTMALAPWLLRRKLDQTTRMR